MEREGATGAADEEEEDDDDEVDEVEEDEADEASSGAAAGSSALSLLASDLTEVAAASVAAALELDAAAEADDDAAGTALLTDGVRGAAGDARKAAGADRDDGVAAVVDTAIADGPAAAAAAAEAVSDDADCELLGELMRLDDDDDDDDDDDERQSASALWYSASFGNKCGRRASSCPPSILTMSRSVSLRTRCDIDLSSDLPLMNGRIWYADQRGGGCTVRLVTNHSMVKCNIRYVCVDRLDGGNNIRLAARF